MATWEAYWSAGVAWVVWMVCYAIVRFAWTGTLRPLVLDLGGDMFKTPVGWIDMVLANWVLIGVVGIFLSVFAAGIVSGRWGGPA